MAQPPVYNRVTSFSNYQAVNPTTPLPGSSVDQELNEIKETLDAVLANLELIQRDDGDLANDSVGLDQLSAEVTVGFNVPEVWVTSTDYTANTDTVFHGSAFYRCLVTHTSGTFATDLSADKWEEIVDLAAVPLVDATQIAFTPTGGIAGATVAAALAELDSEKAATSHTHVATAISDSTSAGRALLTAANVAAQLAALGLTGAAPLYGEIKAYAGITAPSLWLFCGGQAISRTTYASLFAAISISQSGTRTNGSPVITGLSDTTSMRAGMPVSGTGVPSSTTILTVDGATQITLSQNATSSGTNTVVVAPHGVGDGSTTFNVPDLQGRVLAGRDDMVSAASRLTSTTITGTRLGNSGGSQTQTLTEANLASHTHTGTVTDTHKHYAVRDETVVSVTDVTGDQVIANVTNVGTDFATVLVAASGGEANTGRTSVTSHGSITVSNSSTGSGTAHNNVQPTIIENFIIFAGV